MKLEGKRVCEVCGTALSEDIEFCPVCALLRAGGQESAPSETPNPVFDSERNSAETEPSSIVRRFENYEVMLDQDGKPIELGRGAMGITYKAFDTDLRFPVTLKVISEKYVGDESARLRFLREARAAAKVRHTNVASVLHLGRTGSGYFYAMEFVEGETLESLIRRHGPLEVKSALEIAAQVAAGLAAVHKQNLVHRDIKPSNIMVCLEEAGGVTAKIIDLGLAKTVSETALESAISTPGGFVGTPEFASPEQFAEVGADTRSDLYSLGVVFWVMLTGRPPFGGTPAELIYLHQHGVLPLKQLKGVPPQLTAMLQTLLDKDPKRRFQTPAELLKALSRVTNEPGSPGNQKHETATPFVRKVSCRRKALARAKPQERSVAVLPFESLSASKKDTYFADGVQDEILSNLAKISQLKVISRSSVITYRPGANRDLRAIANELGVARVIEGTVRRSGNRVRIATRLVDAQTGETLWSESYDRNLTDTFAIQSEIARSVAAKLRAQLSPQEQKDIEEKPTDNLEAYDLYLQAKQLYNSVVFWGPEKETYLRAISLVEEATQKDPQFALAYCLLAQVHDDLYFGRIDHTPERRALGDAALNEAMRLRPDLPDVHLVLANHLFYLRDFERARVQLAIAARSLPNNSDLLELTALIEQVQGRWEKSTASLERAATLDPRNPHVLYDLANNYVCLRRYRDQRQILDRMTELELDQTLNPVYKAMSFFSEKADVKGIRAACEALPTSVKDDPHWINNRAFFAISARSRFLREARAAASVHHSNVATVHHLGESGGNYFYAMEFVDGETLQTFIRRRGPLDVELALEIVTQVAAGLTAIHKQHLVHRDIKPGNIMLTWDEGRLESVKIIDLGLAKGATEDSLSMAGGFVGTPAYASPEQFAGFGTDIRSDLYSLGVTLWEMLSGRPPFHGSVAELMDQHQHTAPPFERLRNVPAPVIALLQILLAKDPNQRFQSPAQLQNGMTKVREAIASGSGLMADELRSADDRATENLSKGKPVKRLIRWLLGAGACLAV